MTAVRRTSTTRARQPPLLRPTSPRTRARTAPSAPEPADRVDEARGLTAAHVGVERAALRRADTRRDFMRAASAVAACRASVPRSRQPPLTRPTSPRPRTHACAAPSAPEPADRADGARGHAATHVDAERAALSRAGVLATSERGAGYRRTPRERSSRPSAAPPSGETSPRARARAAPPAYDPADRVDEARGLAAAHVAVERATVSRAATLAFSERGVGCRRTPRERSSRPPAAHPAANVTSTSNSSPCSSIRARARRSSRRNARPRRRERRSLARCCQPRRYSRVFRARRRWPPHAARALLAPASRPPAAKLHPELEPAPHHPRTSPQTESTKHAASPPRTSQSSALPSTAPTLSRFPNAASAAAARRASAPRARKPPLPRPMSPRPRTRVRASPCAPEPADRVDEARGLAAAHVDAERAVRHRAGSLALFERGVGCRRTPRERPRARPPPLPAATRHLEPEPAQLHPRPHPKTESKNLAASPPRTSESSALPSAASALSRVSNAASAASARRASAPRARPPPSQQRNATSHSILRHIVRARARRPSRRSARPRCRARKRRARCSQPHRRVRARRARRRPPPHAAPVPLAPANRSPTAVFTSTSSPRRTYCARARRPNRRASQPRRRVRRCQARCPQPRRCSNALRARRRLPPHAARALLAPASRPRRGDTPLLI